MAGQMDWFPEIHSFGSIALAGGLGGLVGLEREFADKPAGLRTHILVAAGSALLMILGDAVIDEFQQRQTDLTIRADPIRVIQAIIIGISFLGAGTIIHAGDRHVEGLTTAASIFLTAGIGIATAVDRIALAVAVSLSAVVILFLVGWLEKWFGSGRDSDT